MTDAVCTFTIAEPVMFVVGDKLSMEEGWVKRRWWQLWKPRHYWSSRLKFYTVTNTYTHGDDA